MKKITFLLSLVAVMFVLSCKKSTPAAGSSWSFKNKKYTVTTAYVDTIGGIFTATNQTPSTFQAADQFILTFVNTPIAVGTYPVGGANATTGQVMISFQPVGLSVTYYNSTGGSGQSVTVSNTNGKLKFSGMNVSLTNTHDSTDTGTATFSITQLN